MVVSRKNYKNNKNANMDIISKLQALRQELCDIQNNTELGESERRRGNAVDRAITATDNLIEALTELEK